MIRHVAGRKDEASAEAQSFALALMEALQIPEIRAEIIRIVGRPSTVPASQLARGQRTRKA